MELEFQTFKEFVDKFPVDEVCIPVCIVPPDDDGDYWLIQVALPMKNVCYDCNIWDASNSEILAYKTKAGKIFKETVGLK